MGIFIKSGILHTLKFHLHTLSCHFWLNLWVLFLSTSLGAQLLKCFHSWDGSMLRSWFHMIGVSDGSLDGYSWMQLLVLCSGDSNGNSAVWWLWLKKKKKKAWCICQVTTTLEHQIPSDSILIRSHNQFVCRCPSANWVTETSLHDTFVFCLFHY